MSLFPPPPRPHFHFSNHKLVFYVCGDSLMAPVARGMMWMDDHTYTHMCTVVPIHCFGMKTKSLSRRGRPRTCTCRLCPVEASSLHPAPVFQPFMHAVFSLTSRSGVRGTLLLKRSVQMPSPSQSLLIYDQSRKGPHLESFPESQASSKFSLACFCSIWSLLPWHVSRFWFSMCVCLLSRELYSLCCIPRH